MLRFSRHSKRGRVCISEVAGVRYDLEEAMRERDLTPEYSCVSADVQVEEAVSLGTGDALSTR